MDKIKFIIISLIKCLNDGMVDMRDSLLSKHWVALSEKRDVELS